MSLADVIPGSEVVIPRANSPATPLADGNQDGDDHG